MPGEPTKSADAAAMSISRAARLRPFASGGERLALRIHGACMVPRLEDGDEVIVEAARRYLPGDVLAIARPDGRVAVHRLLGYRPSRTGLSLVSRGDAAATADPLAPVRGVVGRVVAVRRTREGEPTPFEVALSDRLRAIAGYVGLLGLGGARSILRLLRLS